jgi:hypothetical protein
MPNRACDLPRPVEEVVLLVLHSHRGMLELVQHHTNLLESVLAWNQTNSKWTERQINLRGMGQEQEHQRDRPMVLVELVRQINFLPAMEQEYCQRDHPTLGLVRNRTNRQRGPEQQARIQSRILLELLLVPPENQSQILLELLVLRVLQTQQVLLEHQTQQVLLEHQTQ